MTRSVIIRMRRRLGDEKVQPWRKRINGPAADKLCNDIREWASEVTPQWPSIPEEIQDRDADVWEALLGVADLAGEEWAKAAREAAVTLVTASKQGKPSLGILLLSDLRKVFDANPEDKLPTDDILASLNKMDESPWATIRRGEAMDSRSLSNRLGKYGIGSKPHRDGDRVFKGYSRAQFEDAWKRYVPVVAKARPDEDEENGNKGSDLESDPWPVLGDSSVTSVTAPPELELVTDVTDARRPCPECTRAPARTDTGVCDLCTVKAQAGGQP